MAFIIGGGITIGTGISFIDGSEAPAANDPYFEYVTTLLSGNTSTSTSIFNDDASTNNFAVSVFGDTRPSNFGPYTPGYYSNYFDGTGDYLSLTPNSSLTLNGDYTIEFWVYFASLDTAERIPANCWNTGAGWLISTQSSAWNFKSAGSFTLTYSAVAPAAGQWYHVAATRSGSATNNVKFFINGVQVAQGTNTSTLTPAASSTGCVIGGGQGGTGQLITGYVSNFRIVKGTAVYTANFTPPTQPLTAIANTSLLTCTDNRFIDNSTNNFTITRNGDVKIEGFDPFAPSSSYATLGSTYFDGTGDYLLLPNNAAFSFAGDFTMEAWVYPTALGSNNGILAQWVTGGLSFIFKVVSNRLRFEGNPGTGVTITGTTTTVSLGTWTHLAVSRSGSTVRLFVNGVLDATTGTISGTLASGNDLTVGALNSTTEYWNGYISNLRVINGTALYTTSFTPPTAPLTAVANTSLLTCQANQPNNNNMFLDSSTNNSLITKAGNATQGSVGPYGGGWSNYFDGNGDVLTLSSNAALGFGTGDFTIELWYYAAVAPTSSNVCLYNNGSGNFFLQLRNTAFGIGVSGSSENNAFSFNFVNGQWYHLAVARSGSTVRGFVNGTLAGSGSNTVNYGQSGATIGGLTSSTQLVTGYISNLRTVKGTAVYTANFTVPTQPLTAIAGTSLLTCADNRFIDDSANNFVITSVGNVSVESFDPFGLTTAYTPQDLGGSMYCDGNGDYLSLPYNSVLSQTTAYTLQMWFYPTSTVSTQYLFARNAGGYFGISWNGTVLRVDRHGVGIKITGITTISLNAWHHVAMTYDGSTTRLFADGILQGSVAETGGEASGVTTVGFYEANASSSFYGFISNLSLIKGSALYTTNFTPPTAPVTAVAGTVLLLDSTNAAIYDASINNNFETLGNAKISTAVSKFGGSSMSFDGTGDYLVSFESLSSTFNTGNYTIESWIYRSDSGTQRAIVDTRGASGVGVLFYITSNNKLNLFDTTTTYLSSTNTVPSGEWVHVAATRDSGTTRLFINGNVEATLSNDTRNNVTGTGGLYVGRQFGSTSNDFNGYMQDVRITKGFARYTANFTPPTAALPLY